MEFSQELISIFVLTTICVLLSVFFVILWFCRCRRDQIQAEEEKHERAIQMNNYQIEKQKSSEAKPNIAGGGAAAAPKKEPDIEKAAKAIRASSSSSASSEGRSETIGQYEERITGVQKTYGGRIGGPLQRVKDEEAKNKKLDTISEIGLSTDSLQRNDSKTNVFSLEPRKSGSSSIEVDLNPGLNSSINLDKI